MNREIKKYKVPVCIETYASTVIGQVECNSIEEFKKEANKLWESQDYDYPTANISNDFDLGDWDISKLDDSDLEHYVHPELLEKEDE